jgi:hypothetical protein
VIVDTKKHVVNRKYLIVAVLSTVLLFTVFGGKSEQKENNDTNLTYSYQPVAPHNTTAPPDNTVEPDGCVHPIIPDKITYNYVYRFNSSGHPVHHTKVTRTRISEEPTKRVYRIVHDVHGSMTKPKKIHWKTHSNIIYTEYYTHSKDGLYEDQTRYSTEMGGVDTFRSTDVKATTHPSGKHILQTKNETKTYTFTPSILNVTYSPYSRGFAKFCPGKSYHNEFIQTTSSSDGGRVTSEQNDRSCTVISVNAPLRIKAGDFRAIELSCTSKEEKYKDWVDTKTGLWLRHKGNDGTMELKRYRIDDAGRSIRW